MAELTEKQKAAMRKRIDSYMAKLSNIVSYTINEDMSIDVVGNVKLDKKSYLNKECQLPYQFGKVDGNFVLRGLPLISLAGCPVEVTGNFDIEAKWDRHLNPIDANFFSTLEGGPKKVGGDYYISDAHVTSLEGCPSEVGESFCVYNCPIESLAGSPRKVGGDYYLHDLESLRTVEGMPKKVDGNVVFQDLPSLTSLAGAPEEVGGNLRCIRCGFTNWEGLPKKVGKSLEIRACRKCTIEEIQARCEVSGTIEVNSHKY